MLTRIKFKRRLKDDFPFKYDVHTGSGLSTTGYSVLSDLVEYHRSQMGYRDWGDSYMPRSEFVKMYANHPGEKRHGR